MCGIAGIVSMSGGPVPPPAIKQMCDVIAHRGPDDAGYAFFGADSQRASGQYEFVDPEFRHANQQLPVFDAGHCRNELGGNDFCVALGHRRLSIIDLTHHGHQPMCDPDRKLWIVHNGEIYNFPELRRQLESQGHVFRSGTDTEVILHLWQEHGDHALSMLDGMFAFAIYDRAANTVTLARDRFGIKPLYYAASQGYFIFASEIKAILASGLVEARIDPAALVEYFTFQNTYGPQTLFGGVKMLGAGEYVSCGARQDGAASPRRYHERFPPAEPALAESQDTAEMVAETFAAAVKRQLISDVEVGSYLSGGMDSGSIVSVAGRHIPRLLTFTGGFDLTNVNGIEQGFDEREHAEQLAYLLQTEHYDVVLHAGDMPAAMERITWHMDDPRVGMCHQNWYVAKLASRFVKVCLAGVAFHPAERGNDETVLMGVGLRLLGVLPRMPGKRRGSLCPEWAIYQTEILWPRWHRQAQTG